MAKECKRCGLNKRKQAKHLQTRVGSPGCPRCGYDGRKHNGIPEGIEVTLSYKVPSFVMSNVIGDVEEEHEVVVDGKKIEALLKDGIERICDLYFDGEFLDPDDLDGTEYGNSVREDK